MPNMKLWTRLATIIGALGQLVFANCGFLHHQKQTEAYMNRQIIQHSPTDSDLMHKKTGYIK